MVLESANFKVSLCMVCSGIHVNSSQHLDITTTSALLLAAGNKSLQKVEQAVQLDEALVFK
jgi:hypothetical protein